jgi:glutathione S-transferase
MVLIYGSPRTSAGRCFWALEEAGAPYEYKNVDMRAKEHKSPAYLKLNPNGKVPALVDGEVVLFESMAINSYIAEAYKKELLGNSAAEKALVLQWSFWALAELQAPLIELFIQKVFIPEGQRDQKLIAENLALLPNLFSVLNSSLNYKKYLVGDHFTLADLNVASVVTIGSAVDFDLKPYQNITTWLSVIAERPAFQRYMALRK